MVQQRQRRGLGRWLFLGAMTAMALVLLSALTLLYLIRSEPEHWRQHQQFVRSTTPDQRRELAQNVEDRVEALVHATQMEAMERQAADSDSDAPAQRVTHETGPVVKTVFLTTDEVNAYVAEKFEDWLTYRDYVMPDGLSEPAVSIEKNRLLVSFEFTTHGFSQVFTAGLGIRFAQVGQAIMQLDDVMAGKLSLPPDGIGNHLREHGPDSDRVRQAADWLDKLDRVEFKPSMKLGDRHKAHVITYQVREDGVLVTLKIEQRPGYGKRPQIAAVATDQ